MADISDLGIDFDEVLKEQLLTYLSGLKQAGDNGKQTTFADGADQKDRIAFTQSLISGQANPNIRVKFKAGR